MNTYLVAVPLDDFGSLEETKIQADYFDNRDGELLFTVKHPSPQPREIVAAFAKGFWSRVTKENIVE